MIQNDVKKICDFEKMQEKYIRRMASHRNTSELIWLNENI